MKTLRETILEQFNYCNEIADDIIRHNASKEIIKYAHNWAEIESPVSGEMDAPWIRICFGDIYIFMFVDEDVLDKENSIVLTGQMRYQLDGFGEYGGETIDVDSKEKWLERFNQLTDEELLEQHLEVFDDGDYSCQCPRKYKELESKKTEEKSMKKKITVIAIQEYHKTTNLLVETDADIDVKKALEKAKKWVRENVSAPCRLSEIPEEALREAGLKILSADFIFCGEEDLVTTEADKKGIHFATCRDCGEFDSGVCLKYGGQCDPDADVGTCFFGGDNAVRLCYDGEPFGPIIILDDDYFEDGIKEIMRLLDIKPEIYGVEVNDEELLSIKEESQA